MNYSDYKSCDFADLIGESISRIEGLEKDSDEVLFFCESGKVFCMLHEQDCCESVYIQDVEGDLTDLLRSNVVIAEEASNDSEETPDGSQTWTFYRIQAAAGMVVIRWLGESNGYYSESVNFGLLNPSAADAERAK